MNKDLLRKLAELTMANGVVDEKVQNFVLTKLSKKDTKIYLFHFKNVFKKSQVYVTMTDEPEKNTVEYFAKLFKGKGINFLIDRSLGAGISLKFDDNIINISVKSFIEQAIRKAKNN